MYTIVYEETLTGRPQDTSVQKATSDNEMWMQFNVMPRTLIIIYQAICTTNNKTLKFEIYLTVIIYCVVYETNYARQTNRT